MINDRRFSLRWLRKGFSFTAVAVLFLSASAGSPLLAQEVAATPSSRARPFRMGFTAFPPDVTAEALSQTRQFVRTNADLIAHHIEGVPWAEALADKPFPKELVSANETKRSMKPPGAKVYLAISPGRGELKLAEKGATPLPPELRGKSYDDPAVKRAYLNYCRRSIEFFQPDFLAIGIEVNEIFSAGADKWRAYAELHRHVYRELKREHPGLPIFASYTLHNLFKVRGGTLKACQELMPFNDFVAISFYPFFIGETPDAAFQWLIDNFDSFGKPDFVFLKARVVVFVDGDFWHGHPIRCRIPTSNRTFWKRKLERNKTRDRVVNRTLRNRGWHVLRIWQSTLHQQPNQTSARIKRALLTRWASRRFE